MTVYLGIDWSEKKHNACFLNEAGAVLQEFAFPHKPEGFLQLAQACQQLGVQAETCVVGLETAHNLLIDFLCERRIGPIYIIPPHQVKSNQGRFAHSGAKDDRRDAHLIAEILRTDQRRLHAWQPDSLLTRQIRAQVALISYLSRSIRQNTNYLRALLLRYYPTALDLFSSLDAQVNLDFLTAYPTPQQAQSISFTDFTTFLRKHHHTRSSQWPACYQRLLSPQPEPSSETLAIYTDQTRLMVALLLPLVQAKQAALAKLTMLFDQHPDAPIYRSLPGVGQFLAPALLSKLGDDRQRFPTLAILQAVAGTCPVTSRSGKFKMVLFRRACDHDFRHIVQQWAMVALKTNPVAQAYFHQVRPHCRSQSGAYRRLANRLLAILWRLWQSSQPYQLEYHLRQRALRAKPRPCS